MILTLNELAKKININAEGSLEVTGLNTLLDASNTEVTFLENKKYVKDLSKTKAAAVLVKAEFAKNVPSSSIALICDEPYVNLALLSKEFAPEVVQSQGNDCKVDENCTIMPNTYLGKDSSVGKNCTIMSGAYIGDNVCIGDNTIIYPNVTIYRDCKVGHDCIIHAGTVIGSDGFGFANNAGKYVKIYQNGNVIIGNDVEIGANAAIDRAAFNSTIIEDGVRIDNLVHIAHNCILKRGCILTGHVGLSGSTTLHEYVIMGGQSATAGHLEVAPFTTIAARGGVTKSITEPKKQWAGFPLMEHRTWLRLQSRIAKLLK